MSWSFDLLRRSGRSLLASLALLNLVLEHSVVCRTRQSTQAKDYISRARDSSGLLSSPASDKSEVFLHPPDGPQDVHFSVIVDALGKAAKVRPRSLGLFWLLEMAHLTLSRFRSIIERNVNDIVVVIVCRNVIVLLPRQDAWCRRKDVPIRTLRHPHFSSWLLVVVCSVLFPVLKKTRLEYTLLL
jgi:hypothetical protein